MKLTWLMRLSIMPKIRHLIQLRINNRIKRIYSNKSFIKLNEQGQVFLSFCSRILKHHYCSSDLKISLLHYLLWEGLEGICKSGSAAQSLLLRLIWSFSSFFTGATLQKEKRTFRKTLFWIFKMHCNCSLHIRILAKNRLRKQPKKKDLVAKKADTWSSLG